MTANALSTAGLGQLHDRMAAHVERGALPGLVTLVSRRGQVQVDAIGTQTLGRAAPMRRDTIFRISSMTKPITAAAAMILVEDGTLRLDEPVDRILPELADRRVLTRLDASLDDTVPAHRSITLRDLLTFRMGFGLIWGPQDATPIQRAAAALDLQAFGPPKPRVQPAPDEWMRRFATLPLMHQPGERWMYNTGAEVLGVLLARAAGQPLEALLRTRLFEPLGMKDTAFSVPTEKLDRLATSYMADPVTGRLEVFDEAEGGQWSRPPAFPSAAAGLVSTVDDMLAFGAMMLEKGTLRGVRVLSASSVDAMATDQITLAQKGASGRSLDPTFWEHRGWGLGLSVVTRGDELSPVPGRFGWDGGLGTSWCTDPRKDLVAILMTQRSEYPYGSAVYRDFWTSTYGAIDDGA
jgi:CubicO group peptidase (beta-lactamase class C family)